MKGTGKNKNNMICTFSCPSHGLVHDWVQKNTNWGVRFDHRLASLAFHFHFRPSESKTTVLYRTRGDTTPQTKVGSAELYQKKIELNHEETSRQHATSCPNVLLGGPCLIIWLLFIHQSSRVEPACPKAAPLGRRETTKPKLISTLTTSASKIQ